MEKNHKQKNEGSMEKFVRTKIEKIIGKTLTGFEVFKNRYQKNDEVILTCSDGSVYKMQHYQRGYENVTFYSITDSMKNLIGTPLIGAKHISEHEDNGIITSHTWTKFKFETSENYASILFHGHSDGRYKEGVYFFELRK